MPEWLIIARREFAERVRTRWFIAVTLFAPIGMVALLVIPAWLAFRAGEEKVVIEVVDRTGRAELLDRLKENARLVGGHFELQRAPADADEQQLVALIRDKRINGFLELPAGLLEGRAATYRGDNATNLHFRMDLERALQATALTMRAREAGIEETVNRLAKPEIRLDVVHDTGRGETQSPQASLIAGIAVMFLLYAAIIFYAVNVMRSVMQEKVSRVVEIIVSAVKPAALMLGKIIGVGAVGLLQFAIWAAVALALLRFRGEVLGLFGIAEANVEMPPLGLADVLVVLIDFLLGFFFYASLYAAVGAMVSSDQEAQQIQMPLMLLLILPILCFQLVANDPRGGAAQLLTLVPFWSPILMPMRHLLGGATPAELALSLAILMISIAASVLVAGRIYRVGILMVGKRPSLGELVRWIRHS